MFFLYPYFFNLFSGPRGVSDSLEGGPGSGFERGHLGGGGGGFLYEVAHGFGHGVDQVEMDHLEGSEGCQTPLDVVAFGIGMRAEIIFCEGLPDALHLGRANVEESLGDCLVGVTEGQVRHSQIEERVAPAEIAQVDPEVMDCSMCFLVQVGRDDIADMHIAMQAGAA